MPDNIEIQRDKSLLCLESLAELGETVTSGDSPSRISKEMLHILMGTVGATRSVLLLVDGDHFKVSAARGIDVGKRYRIHRVLKDCIESINGILQRSDGAFPEPLEDFISRYFGTLAIEIVTPLRAQHRIMGMLLLSKRFLGQDYSDVDIRMLNAICRHVSVALLNFSLRQEARDANFKLSWKVLQLEALHDLSLSVAAFKPRNELIHEVLDGAMGLLDARKSVFFPADGGKLRPDKTHGAGHEAVTPFLTSQHAQRIIDGKTVRLKNSPIARTALGFGSFLGVPVQTAQDVYGALIVAGKESTGSSAYFGIEDEKLLEALATQAAVALENIELHARRVTQERLERELETAAAIQKRIVPQPEDLPSIDGYDIYGRNYPCRAVGGDYFDVIPLGDESFAFVLCDVSGKGLPAALLVSTLQATFHSLFRSGCDLTDVALRANRILCRNTPPERYATGCIGIIDIHRGTMQTVNAGHNQPFVIRSSGDMERLSTGGLCFGMFDFSSYECDERVLNSGDSIYLFTDGVSEAFSPDDEEFDEDRIEAEISRLQNQSAKDLNLGIERVVRSWVGDPDSTSGFDHDDFTQLSIRRL